MLFRGGQGSTLMLGIIKSLPGLLLKIETRAEWKGHLSKTEVTEGSHFSQDNWHPDLDMKPGPPEYETLLNYEVR
jgi:hypothetical protein